MNKQTMRWMGRAQAEQRKMYDGRGVVRFDNPCAFCSQRKGVRGCIRCSKPTCPKHARIRNAKLYCPDCAPVVNIPGDQSFELSETSEQFE